MGEPNGFIVKFQMTFKSEQRALDNELTMTVDSGLIVQPF